MLKRMSDHLLAIEDGLSLALAKIPEGGLKEAIVYALFPGGKRLRALIPLIYAELVGAGNRTLGLALAIELAHNYTLIHDDLPALDDARLRRGMPALHRKFSEASAILVGDALQAMAFETLEAYYRDDSAVFGPLVRLLAITLGPNGLVWGQFLDLNTPSPWGQEERASIARLKTGLLFRACFEGTGIVLNYAFDVRETLAIIGESFGVAFQLVDDLKDEYELESEAKKATVKRVVEFEGELRTLLGRIPKGKDLGEILFQALV
jgi:farnesyl diphosphate synthase